MITIIDGNQFTNKKSGINYLKKVLNVQHCTQYNLDAIWDCLGENRITEDQIIYLVNEDRIIESLGDYGKKIISLIHSLPKMNAHYKVLSKENSN